MYGEFGRISYIAIKCNLAMKKISILLITVCMSFMSVSCGVTGSASVREPDPSVVAAIKDKDVSIVVNYIYPSTMSPRPTTDGYTLRIKDDKLNGFLPFFGTSNSGGYSINDGGFNFEDYPIVIKEKKSIEKVEWRFEAVSGTETEKITVTIWDNGTAEIFIQPNTKSSIRFSGELE